LLNKETDPEKIAPGAAKSLPEGTLRELGAKHGTGVARSKDDALLFWKNRLLRMDLRY
jgi:hypothetical protein